MQSRKGKKLGLMGSKEEWKRDKDTSVLGRRKEGKERRSVRQRRAVNV